MINVILLSLALVVFCLSFTRTSIFYRICGFFITFTLLTLIVTKDLTYIFLIMINGFTVHLLLLLSYKEYVKDDD